MQKWQRRMRGAVGMGLTWGLAWFAGGVALALAFPGAADVPFPILWGGFGFVGGVIFSTVLGMREGRRRFDQLSLPRFAWWGAVGGVLLCGLFVAAAALFGEVTPLRHLGLLAPVFAVAGGGSAAGSLALARMTNDPEALGTGADRAELGRTPHEREEP